MSLYPFLKKTNVAGSACAIIAIRLVPLATVEGIPKSIIIGRLIKDPPPATVLITPAAIPAKVSDKTITTSLIIAPPKLAWDANQRQPIVGH